MVTYTHNTSLILVAVIVSVVAAFTGLALTRKIALLPEGTRKALVSMSAVVIAGGIWTMHFVAMLANEFSVPVGYDVVYTLGSGLVSILVVGTALLLLHYAERTPHVLNLAGLIMGAGIVSMHYIGMSAMRGATPHYNTFWVIIALLVAAISGLCAVRLAYGERSKEHIVGGGLILGLSVVIVHFTAMTGTDYVQSNGAAEGTIAIANSTLAIVLVVAVFLICGSFLLVSATFLTKSERASPATWHSEQTISLLSPKTPVLVPESAGVTGGQSAILHKPAEPVQSIDLQHSANAVNDAVNDELDDANTGMRIPYERNKKVSFVYSHEVGAIRADGRYTHLYTKHGVYFCPWSITEAEKRLATSTFYRSHRSYLVNFLNLSSYEKRKDSGVCRFEGYEQLTKVPVSRTRVAGLLELLGLD